jgi:hypothetical protein
LTLGSVDGTAEIWLNGQSLGRLESAQQSFEREITRLLTVRNELVIEVTAPGGNDALRPEVALEVRATAFLHDVRLAPIRTGGGMRLQVTGTVVGTSDQPLELYALLDNKTVLYAPVEALPAGQPFSLLSDEIAAEPVGQICEARVELVHGAVIWYRIERPFP